MDCDAIGVGSGFVWIVLFMAAWAARRHFSDRRCDRCVTLEQGLTLGADLHPLTVSGQVHASTLILQPGRFPRTVVTLDYYFIQPDAMLRLQSITASERRRTCPLLGLTGIRTGMYGRWA
jgi:hypothetical protein